MADEPSGRQQHRVAVARAPVKGPRCCWPKNPRGLDEQTRDEIVPLLVLPQDSRGLALVIVTHDSWVAKRAEHRLHPKQVKVTEKTAFRTS